MDEIAAEKKNSIRNMVIFGASLMIIAVVTIVIAEAQEAKIMETLDSVCSKTDHPDYCYISLKYAGKRPPLKTTSEHRLMPLL